MPITSTFLLVAVATLALLPFGRPAYAQRVVIRNVEQLATDEEVRMLSASYTALSAANVVYKQCDKELSIVPAQKDYLEHKFLDVSKDYLAAYQNAYITRVQAPPKQALVDEMVASIKVQQQKAVDDIARFIQRQTCVDDRIFAITNYVEALRKRDAVPAASNIPVLSDTNPSSVAAPAVTTTH